ncbi:hypothetical protein [Caproicibacter sp. BJN0012]|uniref:hypothetical protein n=1 Tax=Caproicibacter sp. BJN0012 TaxID=3110227 RepID=UPI002E0E2B4F
MNPLRSKIQGKTGLLSLLLEAMALLSVCASSLTLILRYNLVPEQIPDLFSLKSETISKNYLLYLLVLQVVSYFLLALFQAHPEWRMYSTKLLPDLKNERTRRALYRFSSFSLLTAKAEIAFTLSVIVIGTAFEKNITGPVIVMMAVMLFTLIFFKTDLPKQNA